MTTFINVSNRKMQSVYIANARAAIAEVLEQHTSPADGDLLGDTQVITQPLESLKSLHLYPAYSGVKTDDGVVAGWDIYLAFQEHRTRGAVEGFVIVSQWDGLTLLLTDIGHLWHDVSLDLYALLGACAPERVPSLLDFREAFKDLRK